MTPVMAIKKTFLSVEMTDGTEHENIRITIQDQLAWGKTAKNNGWNPEDAQAVVFLIWKALHRLGLYSGSYEQFRDTDALDVAEGEQPEQAGPTE